MRTLCDPSGVGLNRFDYKLIHFYDLSSPLPTEIFIFRPRCYGLLIHVNLFIFQPLSLTIMRLDYILDEIENNNTNDGRDRFKISCVEYNDMPGSILLGERTTDLSRYFDFSTDYSH